MSSAWLSFARLLYLLGLNLSLTILVFIFITLGGGFSTDQQVMIRYAAMCQRKEKTGKKKTVDVKNMDVKK